MSYCPPIILPTRVVTQRSLQHVLSVIGPNAGSFEEKHKGQEIVYDDNPLYITYVNAKNAYTAACEAYDTTEKRLTYQPFLDNIKDFQTLVNEYNSINIQTGDELLDKELKSNLKQAKTNPTTFKKEFDNYKARYTTALSNLRLAHNYVIAKANYANMMNGRVVTAFAQKDQGVSLKVQEACKFDSIPEFLKAADINPTSFETNYESYSKTCESALEFLQIAYEYMVNIEEFKGEMLQHDDVTEIEETYKFNIEHNTQLELLPQFLENLHLTNDETKNVTAKYRVYAHEIEKTPDFVKKTRKLLKSQTKANSDTNYYLDVAREAFDKRYEPTQKYSETIEGTGYMSFHLNPDYIPPEGRVTHRT